LATTTLRRPATPPRDPGEQDCGQHLRQEARDLREQDVDRLGDDGEAQGLEHRQEDEEHDDPADEPSDVCLEGEGIRPSPGDLRGRLLSHEVLSSAFFVPSDTALATSPPTTRMASAFRIGTP
jgi:hypothetical protein